MPTYKRREKAITTGDAVYTQDPDGQGWTGTPTEPDNVHPNHYKLPNGMQVVDVEVAMFGKEAVQAHCLSTALEYILRHKQKSGVEDIRKAHWWLSEYLELEG